MTPIGRLRLIAFVEGCSFLLLLGVGMPLKYLADMPVAVRVTGSLHGALFFLFLLALLHVALAARWRLSRAALVLGSALVPFGTFAMDGSLRREDEQARRN
jgi:integral membrane protein